MAGVTNREILWDALVSRLEAIKVSAGFKTTVKRVTREWHAPSAVGINERPLVCVFSQPSGGPPTYEQGARMLLPSRIGITGNVEATDEELLTERLSNLEDDVIASLHSDLVLQGGTAAQTKLVHFDYDEGLARGLASFFHIWELRYERPTGQTT